MECIGRWHKITRIQFFSDENWGYAMSEGQSIGPITRAFQPRNNQIRGDFSKLPTKEIHGAHNGGV